MRKSNFPTLKGAFAALRGLFPMAPAKRELAEVKRHRDLVKLSPGEQRTRDLMLKDALDTGSMVALAGTENRIAQMVAEQTRGFRAQINEMHGHVSALSQRIGQLENPNQPRFGEIGSGTGVFPRSRKRKSDTSEIAGRPGTLKDAVAEGVAGEMARREAPSKLEARTISNETISGGRNVQFRGDLLSGVSPPKIVDARDGLRSGTLHTSREYPCGCRASGPGDVPNYCPTHGKPPSVSYVTGTAEEVSAARERLQAADLDELRRMASAGAPLIDVDRYSGMDPPLPDACCEGPLPP